MSINRLHMFTGSLDCNAHYTYYSQVIQFPGAFTQFVILPLNNVKSGTIKSVAIMQSITCIISSVKLNPEGEI